MVLKKLQEISTLDMIGLCITMIVIVFGTGSMFTGQAIECGRHEGSDICFCDCFSNFVLQSSEKRIYDSDLSFQNTVWTAKYLFDAEETFGKGTTNKQCLVSGLSGTGYGYRSPFFE